MLTEIAELLKVLADNKDQVSYIEYRRNQGEHFTFSTYGQIEKRKSVRPENWTECDLCERLTECLRDGDLVDIQFGDDKRPHYKPSSLYPCPEKPIALPGEEGVEE